MAIIGLTNFTVDPSNVFGNPRLEKRIAKAVADGLFVEFPDRFVYGDRTIQKFLIAHRAEVPAVVVLGSSRAAQIRASSFPDRTFFNHWVSSAVIEDFLAITDLYFEKGRLPDTFVISLDPWHLNARHGVRYFYQLFDPFLAMSEVLKVEIPVGRYSRARRLGTVRAVVSLSYFRDSLLSAGRGLMHRGKPEKAVNFLKSDSSAHSVYRPDGSLKYPDDYVPRSAAEMERRARDDAKNWGGLFLDEFQEIDRFYFTLLSKFVAYLRGHGRQVVLLLAPHHPVAFATIANDLGFRRALESEEIFREIAASTGARIVGSFDPAKAGCDGDQFIDGNHPAEACVAEILNRR